MENCKLLQPEVPNEEENRLYQAYRQYIVGHEVALRRLTRLFTIANTLGGQMRESDKPAGIFFSFGTTGSGKTLLAEITAKLFFGSFYALTKIKCGELQLKHQITTLTGAPPSYVGFDRETFLTQEKLDRWGFAAKIKDPVARRYFQLQARIDAMFAIRDSTSEIERTFLNSAYGYQVRVVDAYQRALSERRSIEPLLAKAIEERDKILIHRPELGELKPEDHQETYNPERGYPSVVLVDEFEKADDAVRILLLEALDKAEITVQGQQGHTISFRNTFFFLTSNIAQDKMLEITGGKHIGYLQRNPKTEEELKTEAEKVRQAIFNYGYDVIAKTFSPEFVGRVGEDNIFAFAPLTQIEQHECLERITIPQYNKELSKRFPITVNVTQDACKFLISESLNEQNRILGMRALKSVFKQHVRGSIASLMAQDAKKGGIIPGDEVTIDVTKTEKGPKIVFWLKRDRNKNVISQEELIRLAEQKKDLEGDMELVTFDILPEDN